MTKPLTRAEARELREAGRRVVLVMRRLNDAFAAFGEGVAGAMEELDGVAAATAPPDTARALPTCEECGAPQYAGTRRENHKVGCSRFGL